MYGVLLLGENCMGDKCICIFVIRDQGYGVIGIVGIDNFMDRRVGIELSGCENRGEAVVNLDLCIVCKNA